MKEYFVYFTAFSDKAPRPLEKNMIVTTDLTGRPLYDYICRQAEDNVCSVYKDTIIIKTIICLSEGREENGNLPQKENTFSFTFKNRPDLTITLELADNTYRDRMNVSFQGSYPYQSGCMCVELPQKCEP